MKRKLRCVFAAPTPGSLEKGVRLFQGEPRPSPTGEGVFPWKQALRVPQIAIARYANRHPIFRRSAPSPVGEGGVGAANQPAQLP